MIVNKIIVKKYNGVFEQIKNLFYIDSDGKSIYYNIILSLLTIFAFFFPDFLLKFKGASHVQFDIIFTFAFFIFGLTLSLIKNKKVVLVVVGIYFIFETIQLHYMAYFGKPITSPEIKKIFSETSDIAQSGFAYFFVVWYVLPAMIFSYGLYIYLFVKYSDRCFKIKIAYIILAIVLLSKPERAYRKNLNNFLPGPTKNSIYNTISTSAYFLVKDIWSSNNQLIIPFKEYKIEKIENFEKPNIIIFLVAESLNYKHLELYGYERNTTPNLNRLKNNDNFIFRKGISSSIATASSLPFLFNTIREPGNFKLLANKNNNIVKLAKQENYKTYFFTTQESKTLNDLGVEYFDRIIFDENSLMDSIGNEDDILLEYLAKTLKRNEKYQFISIFQRNLHSPYENNYNANFAKWNVKNQKSRKDRVTNSYDNAVLYEDYLIGKVIEQINKIKDKSIILVVTADHGQLLGEDNMYGHNILDPRVAQIPFMVYYNNKYKKVFDKNNIPENISHYEISKFMANLIGYNIVNPNEDGILFIHGSNIYYDNFIIPYIRNNGEVTNFITDSTYNYFKKQSNI